MIALSLMVTASICDRIIVNFAGNYSPTSPLRMTAKIVKAAIQAARLKPLQVQMLPLLQAWATALVQYQGH